MPGRGKKRQGALAPGKHSWEFPCGSVHLCCGDKGIWPSKVSRIIHEGAPLLTSGHSSLMKVSKHSIRPYCKESKLTDFDAVKIIVGCTQGVPRKNMFKYRVKRTNKSDKQKMLWFFTLLKHTYIWRPAEVNRTAAVSLRLAVATSTRKYTATGQTSRSNSYHLKADSLAYHLVQFVLRCLSR